MVVRTTGLSNTCDMSFLRNSEQDNHLGHVYRKTICHFLEFTKYGEGLGTCFSFPVEIIEKPAYKPVFAQKTTVSNICLCGSDNSCFGNSGKWVSHSRSQHSTQPDGRLEQSSLESLMTTETLWLEHSTFQPA